MVIKDSTGSSRSAAGSARATPTRCRPCERRSEGCVEIDRDAVGILQLGIPLAPTRPTSFRRGSRTERRRRRSAELQPRRSRPVSRNGDGRARRSCEAARGASVGNASPQSRKCGKETAAHEATSWDSHRDRSSCARREQWRSGKAASRFLPPRKARKTPLSSATYRTSPDSTSSTSTRTARCAPSTFRSTPTPSK